ncbi:MAG: hypothetical protein EOP11_13115 [Proteobacteria bacterium]|nr:MAG: hypothetical protein EOP11_13115 [Pseudomonadota bacterium]
MKSLALLALALFAPQAHADVEIAKGRSVVKCVVKDGGPTAAAEAAGELTSVLNNLQVQVATSDASMGSGFSVTYVVRPPFAVSQPTLTLVENRRSQGFVATVCVTITKE